ncbi:hypothetical protein QFC22_002161 [Naganishia vaughanmartiniae]|uniref:Uncharacterized protein n=1 Tax=Naganishia vaughanmartiniae TaxID=1424756 RepID=A0ACC2XCK0_9TREE|nr:hypothetical protein QFC22_002161 [Naganishia vaughanmartiniae]
MAAPIFPTLDVPPCPRTLILDFRDSYTANLLTLFSTLYPPPRTNNFERDQNGVAYQLETEKRVAESISEKVIIVEADTLELSTYLRLIKEKQIDCVILSPGPGRADDEKDVPNLMQIIQQTSLPILGVCLGMQAIAVHCGASIINTPDLKHGHVIPVKHKYTSLFDRLPHAQALNGLSSTEQENKEELKAEGQADLVAYNSLTVSWNNFPHDKLCITAWHDVNTGTTESENRNVDAERTIQAIEGIHRPVWGVQFHPESIASAHGAEILCSFLNKTHTFHGSPVSFPKLSTHVLNLSPIYQGLDGGKPSRPAEQTSEIEEEDAMLESIAETFGTSSGRSLNSEEMFTGLIDRIHSPLGQVWLDGVSTRAPSTSSIAFPSFIITYTISTRTVTCHFLSSTTTADSMNHVKTATMRFASSPDGHDDDFFNWFGRGQTALKRMNMTQGERWKARQPSVYCATSEEDDRKPRWKGGWVGWWGYEMKAESLGGYHRPSRGAVGGGETVDACWAWCNRLVQREQDGLWTARGILGAETSKEEQTPESHADLSQREMLSWLEGLGVDFGTTRDGWKSWIATCHSVLAYPDIASVISNPGSARMPDFQCDMTADQYLQGIHKCRQAIYNGNSYELTMTTQFRSRVSSASREKFETTPKTSNTSPESLDLYLQLRQQNPAPYSTYLCFPSVRITILSSSPERFLRITPGGRIEMKPIKGTRARVRYPRDVPMCAEALIRTPTESEAASWCEEKDRQIGEALRNDRKERAENLMVRIVDLIRSDLQSCCTPDSVQVPKLIALETYETVHQLVTTVRGQLLDGVSEVEAVKRSFPPGSMTGAPKLRSVQLLEQFEQHQSRGVYSGAMGYMSIDGAVDLSVVIRTIIIQDGQPATAPCRESDLVHGDRTEAANRYMTIGAGGAITWLSDPLSEWDEVLTKVRSVVG